MQEPLRIQCSHFLDCIQNGETPQTDGINGLRVVQVLEAAQESLDKQGASVQLEQASPVAPALNGKATVVG